MPQSRVRKAIIPVAGLGTRFLPATKAQPKEMLTIVDKPIIQYIVEEAAAAGIEQIIFITSQNKRAIEDHFDRNFELEYRLEKKGKKETLGQILDITDLAQFVYVRQRSPKGDGDAILCARELVGDEPCAVFFGDDIVGGRIPAIKQLMDVYEQYDAPVVGVAPKEAGEIQNYGVIDGEDVGNRTYRLNKIVEKPAPGTEPSNLAIVGRYIITPEIFEILANITPTKDGEIRLSNAYEQYIKTNAMYAHAFDGTWYDCGNKLEFLKATVELGKQHPEVGPAFTKFLSQS
jgi:UTP--glucose-1-phosphate uridylyltransferase